MGTASAGVGTTPWRMRVVEEALAGALRDEAVYGAAAQRAADGAVPRRRNAFKLDLMKRTLARALKTAGGRA
jgi:xanthine dehydrogenase YagS FAD-binding subunit